MPEVIKKSVVCGRCSREHPEGHKRVTLVALIIETGGAQTVIAEVEDPCPKCVETFCVPMEQYAKAYKEPRKPRGRKPKAAAA